MTKEFLYSFIKQHRLTVISSINEALKPEAALIGFAISEKLEIIFDTLSTSRKYKNISQNPNVALVIGWGDETTVQYEGTASQLAGPEDDQYREIYYEVYSDGRDHAETWAGLVHFKVSPKWIRYSNFNEPVVIEEMAF